MLTIKMICETCGKELEVKDTKTTNDEVTIIISECTTCTDSAYDSGHEDAYSEAYSKGYIEGKSDGYDEGYSSALDR